MSFEKTSPSSPDSILPDSDFVAQNREELERAGFIAVSYEGREGFTLIRNIPPEQLKPRMLPGASGDLEDFSLSSYDDVVLEHPEEDPPGGVIEITSTGLLTCRRGSELQAVGPIGVQSKLALDILKSSMGLTLTNNFSPESGPRLHEPI